MAHCNYTESRISSSKTALFSVTLLLLVLCSLPAFAKGGDTLLQSTDLQPHRQQAAASVVDSEGNVIVTGFRNLTTDTNDDYWTVKFATDGSIVWRKHYDGNGGSDRATALVTDGDDNIIVTGYAWNGSNNDVHTIKYSGGDGSVIWEHTYSGLPGGNESGSAVAYDSSSNMIYVGGSVQNAAGNQDFLVLKYDNTASGPTNPPIGLFTQGGTAGGNDSITSLAARSGVLAATGTSWNGLDFDVLTIIFEANGTVRWQQPYASTGTYQETGRHVKFDAAGNVVMAATVANQLDYDIYLVKYAAANGEILWAKTYNGAFDDEPMGLAVSSDGDVYLTGYTWTLAGSNDFYTARYNGTTGELVWQQIYNSGYDNSDIATATGIAVDDSTGGDLFVTGYTVASGNYDYRTIKYKKESGHLLWQRSFNGIANLNDRTVGIALAPNNGVYVVGWSDSTAPITAETSTSTGGSVSTVVNSAKSWSTNQWAGNYVRMTSGGNNGEERQILSNSANSLTVSSNFSSSVSSGDGYSIYEKATGGTTSTIDNSAKSWSTNQWANFYIVMTSGGNAGIERKIVSNTATTLSVSPAFGSAVSAGATYFLFDKDNYDIHIISYDRGNLNPPTGLTSETISKAGDGTYTIKLTWEDNSSDETGFIIERKLGELGGWEEVTRVGANVTTYNDAGRTANEYYYYRVKSYRTSEESYPSDETHSLTFLVTYLTPLWTQTYNGGLNKEDYISAIAVGPDDNPVVTGSSDNGDDSMFDFYTLKLNRATGAVLWEDRYNSMQNEMDNAVCLAVDNNNDIVVSGFSSLYYAPAGGNVHSLFTMKYPATGPPATWEKQYNGPGGIDDRSTAIASTTDGSNLYVTGYGQNSSLNNDIYLVKYLADGTQAWAITPINKGRHDYPVGITLDTGGNILIAGYSQGTRGAVTDLDNFDFYVAKFSADGVKVWEDIHNPYTTGDARAAGIAVDPDGDVYVTGYVTNDDGNRDFYTIKYLGLNGNRVWTRQYDGPAHGKDWPVGVRVDPIVGKNSLDGNIVVVGTQMTDSLDSDSDIHLIRYSTDGEVRWERTLLRPHTTETAEAFTLDGSGYIYIAGDTGAASERDVIAVIYDYEGTLLGGTTYSGGNGFDQASSIAANHQGEAFIAGYTTNSSGNADYLVIKQKNSYMLVPTPFVATPLADFSKITLTWRDNSPGTRFRIEKTMGPATTNSVWESLTDLAPGTATYTHTGLTSNTQYCYRIESYLGTLPSRKVITCGTTTLPAPVLSAATGVTTTGLTISWTGVTYSTGYKVERKIGSGAWATAPNGILAANITSYSDSGLTAGTQYTYRVSALNAGGYSVPSELAVTTNPLAPTLTATPWNPTQINLSWTNVSGETGYRVERRYGLTGTWTVVATKTADTLIHNDPTVVQNSEYFFRVIAYNSNGESAPSTEQRAVTVTSSGVSITAISKDDPVNQPSSVRLSWAEYPSATGYIIQEDTYIDPNNTPGGAVTWLEGGTNWGGWWSQQGYVLPAGTTTYVRSGLSAGTAYRYRIIANIPLSNNPSIPTTTVQSNLKGGWATLQSPLTLTLTPGSITSLVLSWSDIVGETGYTIERKTGQSGTWSTIATAAMNAITYTDSGLAQQTEYCYRVTPASTAGGTNFLLPTGMTASEVKCLPTPLPAPTLNPLVHSTATEVTVSWNNISGNEGYELQRCLLNDQSYPNWVSMYLTDENYWPAASCSVLTTGTDVSIYVDSGRTAGYSYRYKVRVKYGSGLYYSAYSTPLGTTMKPPVTTISQIIAPSSTQLTVSWGNIYGELSYNLDWKVRSGSDCTAGTWSTITSATDMNTTSYTHSGLSPNTYYCYRVMGVNGSLVADPSAAVAQTTTPAPPVQADLQALSASSVKVNWGAVTGATGYRVYRRLYPGGSYSIAVDNLSSSLNEWTNDSLSAGTQYAFVVQAKNTAGYSTNSNEKTTTTTPAAATIKGAVASNAAVDLTWMEMIGATHYKVERRTPGGTWGEIANRSVPYVQSYCGYPVPRLGCQSLVAESASYTNSSLTGGTTYCYHVYAWNTTGGNSIASNELCLTTGEIAAPALTATAQNSLHVGLNWSYTPGTCASGSCEAPNGFSLEKLVNGNWQRIALTDAATTSYTDIAGIDPNRTYSYRAQAFNGAIYTFDTALSSSAWSQWGVILNSSGATVSDVTASPLNVVDPVNGTSRISVQNGMVQLYTTSTGGGAAANNATRLSLVDPSVAHGDFDVTIDYSMPDPLTSPSQYHTYGRLVIWMPSGTGGSNGMYIDRTTSGYDAGVAINGVTSTGTLATSDTRGKLKLSRNGSTMTSSVLVNGAWQVVASASGASTDTATTVRLGQFALRSEAIALKINFDNLEVTSNKSAYSPTATATTPGYTTADGNCP